MPMDSSTATSPDGVGPRSREPMAASSTGCGRFPWVAPVDAFGFPKQSRGTCCRACSGDCSSGNFRSRCRSSKRSTHPTDGPTSRFRWTSEPAATRGGGVGERLDRSRLGDGHRHADTPHVRLGRSGWPRPGELWRRQSTCPVRASCPGRVLVHVPELIVDIAGGRIPLPTCRPSTGTSRGRRRRAQVVLSTASRPRPRRRWLLLKCKDSSRVPVRDRKKEDADGPRAPPRSPRRPPTATGPESAASPSNSLRQHGESRPGSCSAHSLSDSRRCWCWVFTSNSERTSVMVAARDIDPGEVIQRRIFERSRWARSTGLPGDSPSQQELIVGRAARGPIPAGTVVNTDLFVESGSRFRRALSVAGAALAPGATPVSGLRAGDRVDVLALARTTAGLMMAHNACSGADDRNGVDGRAGSGGSLLKSGCPSFFLPMPSRSSRRQQVMAPSIVAAGDRRMIVVLGSVRGSPGVTSWSLLLAAAWPGGSGRTRRGGGRCGRWSAGRQIRMGCEPGVAAFLASLRRNGDAELLDVEPFARWMVENHVWVMPEPESGERARAVLGGRLLHV